MQPICKTSLPTILLRHLFDFRDFSQNLGCTISPDLGNLAKFQFARALHSTVTCLFSGTIGTRDSKNIF